MRRLQPPCNVTVRHQDGAILSVNDVPKARELYSGADSITSLCSGKNSSKPELLVVHRGNPVASTGMGGAILLPQQD